MNGNLGGGCLEAILANFCHILYICLARSSEETDRNNDGNMGPEEGSFFKLETKWNCLRGWTEARAVLSAVGGEMRSALEYRVFQITL
jgi:hypothetical protein